MLLDVLIPTNGQLIKLQPLLESIASQTLQPDRVVILVHKVLKKDALEMLQYFVQRTFPELSDRVIWITNLTAEYEPGKRRGHDRNILISHARSKYVYMIDHDNVFAEDLFEKTADRYMRVQEQYGKMCLVSPTIMWRKTGKIQSQGITRLWYLVPKYIYGKMGAEHRQQVQMLGANSLFAPRTLFETFSFDERFGRCMEDIDFTYRVHLAGYPVVVLNKAEIHHMESQKTRLERLFLGDSATAYERARNRIGFVKKNATLLQKIAYFGCGVWIQTLRFIGHILVFGKKKTRRLFDAVMRGTKDGLLY